MLGSARFSHSPFTQKHDAVLVSGSLKYARLELGASTEGLTRDQHLAVDKGIGDWRDGIHERYLLYLITQLSVKNNTAEY